MSETVTIGPIKVAYTTRLSWGIDHPHELGGRTVWLARSLVECSDPDCKRGDVVEFNVPRWKAEEEGLIERPAPRRGRR